MADSVDRRRRRFCGGCLSAAALAGILPRRGLAAQGDLAPYARARLVDRHGQPVRVADLAGATSYLFAYPYVSTPCFLIDLGRRLDAPVTLETRDGDPYQWRGGVGPGRSVVAFSAICSHRMTHPSRQVSFINYHPAESAAEDGSGAGVIHCCSENSIYDPAAGGRVLSGPAPEPLAAIALEYDPATDGLTAVGAYGGTLFQRFLDAFGPRLALEHGGERYSAPMRDATPVMTLEEYSRVEMHC